MNNVILGSGIVGLLARHILGPSWKVIPFYRSRFFSFNPALDDNFIIQDQELDPYIKDLTNTIGPVRSYQYRRAWSIKGHLLSQYDKGLCQDWLHKVFGSQVPPQSEPYYRSKMLQSVYDIRVNGLYYNLATEYMEELRSEASFGVPTTIGQHHLIRNGVRLDFDNCVSTIPLQALYKLMGSAVQLPSKTLHYLHIETEHLDFEGANQLQVVDPIFDFYKVTNISPNRYLLYMHNDVPDPGVYLMNFIPKFEIIDGTSVAEALPLGPIPKLDTIDAAGIFCVGSNAQWDWCMDVGSCILRLLRYAGRGYKPATATPMTQL